VTALNKIAKFFVLSTHDTDLLYHVPFDELVKSQRMLWKKAHRQGIVFGRA